ncbi:pre-mRNA-splicing factor CWC22 homolog [Papaver somniferum]|uniref:pre-mRNA-splicing factor CWC22 homolog n=1 Tax=Papaver somniferum TaxID=3469 RepID=UPI000E6FB014|nr:pre-mRNA-splicing factor CWC22 homolog [Papaver somniferum]
MDVRKSPRLPKNSSTASPFSSTGLKLKPTSTASPSSSSSSSSSSSPSSTPNHNKQTNKLISTSFIPPKLKSTPVSTTTTEKSHAVEAEKPKKKNNGGRVWKDKDEILLLTAIADYVKIGENPNSVAFCEFIQPKFSVDVDFGQIRSKIRHTKDTYLEKEKEEKKGIVLKFKTPHHKECYELSKPIWGSGGEGSETAGVENEDDAEIRKSKRGKKMKAGSMIQTKDGNATGANEQLEEVDAVVEKAATVEKRQHRKDGAEGSEAADQANKKKQGKKVGDKKHGKAGAGDVEAKADGQEEGKKKKRTEVEKERSKKKKKKRTEVGNADNVLEKLKPTADKQQECLCQLMTHQCKEQLTKAPFDLESSLNEKILQSIEPSKVMAYQQKWKEMRIAEMELFLKKNDLVREGSLLVLEALKAPPS